jgi:hypothetical protein
MRERVMPNKKQMDQAPDPLLIAARKGLIDKQLAEVICMTHGDRVQAGIEAFEDDCGGAPRVGAWKRRRSF